MNTGLVVTFGLAAMGRLIKAVRTFAAGTIIMTVSWSTLEAGILHGRNDTYVPIRDFDKAITSVVLSGAPNGSSISRVTIQFGIAHTCFTDLKIWVTAYYNADWHDFIIYDRDIGGSISCTGEPLLFQDSRITGFWNGANPNQEWYFDVEDQAAADEGYIDYFEIWVEYNEPTCDVQANYFRWTPGMPVEGEQFTIETDITNFSGITASNVEVDIYLSRDGDTDVTDGDSYVGRGPPVSIPVGSTRTLTSVVIFPNIGTGEYPVWIVAVIDPRGTLACHRGPEVWILNDPFTARDRDYAFSTFVEDEAGSSIPNFVLTFNGVRFRTDSNGEVITFWRPGQQVTICADGETSYVVLPDLTDEVCFTVPADFDRDDIFIVRRVPRPNVDVVYLDSEPSGDITITLGQSFELLIQASNYGGLSTDGLIQASFPTLTGPNDDQYVAKDTPWVTELVYHEYDSSGPPIWYRCGGARFQANPQYVLVDAQDSSWGQDWINIATFLVTPPRAGDFPVYIKVAMGIPSGQYYWDPSNAQLQDQQCEFVYERMVHVIEPSACSMTVHSYSSSAVDVTEGDSIWVQAEVANAQGSNTSPDVSIDLLLSPGNDWSTTDDYFVGRQSIGSVPPGSTLSTPRWEFTFPNLGSGDYSIWLIFVINRVSCDSATPKTFKGTTPFAAHDRRFTFNTRVQDEGGLPVSNFRLTLNDTETRTDNTGSVVSTWIQGQAVTICADGEGNHLILPDLNGSVCFSVTADSSRTDSFIVRPIPTCRLAIDSITVRTLNVTEGNQEWVEVSVSNSTIANTSPSVSVDLYLSPGDDINVSDDYYLGKKSMALVPPGQKLVFPRWTFTFPDLGSGDYNVWLVFIINQTECDAATPRTIKPTGSYTAHDSILRWCRDADGDGFGNSGLSTTGATKPEGYVTDCGDCNDSDPGINPNSATPCCSLFSPPTSRLSSNIVYEGDPVWIEAEVTNRDVANASADAEIEIYLSPGNDGDLTDDYYLGSKTLTGLNPGSTKSARWDFYFPDLGQETYKMWVIRIVRAVSCDPTREVRKGVEPFTVHDPTQLKLYSQGDKRFVSLYEGSDRFIDSLPTILITHGWQWCPPFCNTDVNEHWLGEMSNAISERMNQQVNIIIWDWLDDATSLFAAAASAKVEDQAAKLVKALTAVIQGDYLGPIHVMGHSHGAFLIAYAADTIKEQGMSVEQVTLWDPADLGVILTPKLGTLTETIRNLRTGGVYCDLYRGITDLVFHDVNLFVEVPCENCSPIEAHASYQWYLESLPEDKTPTLYANLSCSDDEKLSGTLGFGTSVVLGAGMNRPTSTCEELYTLGFYNTFLCEFDEFSRFKDKCLNKESKPEVVSQLDVERGICQGNCTITTTEFSLSTSGTGAGGGIQGQGAGEIISALELGSVTVLDDWDYLTFEYDFIAALELASFEVHFDTATQDVLLFLITSEAVLEESFISSRYLDVRLLHGVLGALRFELHSTSPSASIVIRNLNWWKSPAHGNNAPLADAGSDLSLSARAEQLVSVTLDGSNSGDSDGDVLDYSWVLDGRLLTTGARASVDLGVGRHVITLVVIDILDAVGTDDVIVDVIAFSDADGDGVDDLSDNCKEKENPSQEDSDGDMIGNACDNCPLNANPDQADGDRDGVGEACEALFRRGDINGDYDVDISDVIFILLYLFAGTVESDCLEAGDADDSGSVDVSDAIFLLAYLFKNGAAPPIPGPRIAGRDPTLDPLTCDYYPD